MEASAPCSSWKLSTINHQPLTSCWLNQPISENDYSQIGMIFFFRFLGENLTNYFDYFETTHVGCFLAGGYFSVERWGDDGDVDFLS